MQSTFRFSSALLGSLFFTLTSTVCSSQSADNAPPITVADQTSFDDNSDTGPVLRGRSRGNGAREGGRSRGGGGSDEGPTVLDRQFIEGKLPRGVRYVSDVLFKEVDGLELKLDLLLPAKSELEKTPVAVWIHGGAWMRGNKARDLRRFDQLVARVLRRGVAFVSIEYRLSGQATFPAQVVDCNDAIAFLHRNRDQYNLDVGSLILMGSSAGGHLATLVGVTHAKGIPGFSSGYDSSDVHIMGVVDFYGPIDLLKLQGKRDAVDLSSDRSPEARLLGHSPRLRPESARLASPSTHIDPESPPFLIFHGDQDKRVPLDQSELLLSLLQKHGVQSRLVIVEGAVHGDEKFDETSYNDAVLTFMDSLLRESPAK